MYTQQHRQLQTYTLLGYVTGDFATYIHTYFTRIAPVQLSDGDRTDTVNPDPRRIVATPASIVSPTIVENYNNTCWWLSLFFS